MDRDFSDRIKQLQTFLHDQINAAKADADKALQDSEASLQIGAELEQHLNKLVSEGADTQHLVQAQGLLLQQLYQQVTSSQLRTRQIEIDAGTTHLCWYLSIIITMGILSSINNPSKQGQYVSQLEHLIDFSKEAKSRINQTTTIKEADSVALQFTDSYLALQSKVFDISRR